MATNGQYYSDTGRDFLARARTYLAEEDLLQASEKGWGAAAQMVKAAAESRGWRHRGHRDLYTAQQAGDETGDQRLFHTASTRAGNLARWLSRACPM